jgi:hypothetical protein
MKIFQGEFNQDLHFVILEELFEFPLSSRVSEIPNVQPTTFGSTGKDGVLRGTRGVLNAGIGQVVGEIVDGRRHCG